MPGYRGISTFILNNFSSPGQLDLSIAPSRNNAKHATLMDDAQQQNNNNIANLLNIINVHSQHQLKIIAT